MDPTNNLYVPMSFFLVSKSYSIFYYYFQAINVQGNTITLPSGQSSYAAIDTGTTLIGGPQQQISKIFAQIPGSVPGTGDFQNYYIYRSFFFFFFSKKYDNPCSDSPPSPLVISL